MDTIYDASFRFYHIFLEQLCDSQIKGPKAYGEKTQLSVQLDFLQWTFIAGKIQFMLSNFPLLPKKHRTRLASCQPGTDFTLTVKEFTFPLLIYPEIIHTAWHMNLPVTSCFNVSIKLTMFCSSTPYLSSWFTAIYSVFMLAITARFCVRCLQWKKKIKHILN